MYFWEVRQWNPISSSRLSLSVWTLVSGWWSEVTLTEAPAKLQNTLKNCATNCKSRLNRTWLGKTWQRRMRCPTRGTGAQVEVAGVRDWLSGRSCSKYKQDRLRYILWRLFWWMATRTVVGWQRRYFGFQDDRWWERCEAKEPHGNRAHWLNWLASLTLCSTTQVTAPRKQGVSRGGQVKFICIAHFIHFNLNVLHNTQNMCTKQNRPWMHL